MSAEQTSTGTDSPASQPWWTRHSDSELLDLAKSYPYPTAGHSYIFLRGRSFELVDWNCDPLRDGRVRHPDDVIVSITGLLADFGIRDTPPLSERTPVLAYGSNAAPSQLARKYHHMPDAVIPVFQAFVSDIDVVYSAHLTRYGAIPATLAASPSTILQTSMTWLAADELVAMHESEVGRSGAVPGNYSFGEFRESIVSSEVAFDGRPVRAYVSRFGALGLREAPLALAPVSAAHRSFTAYTKKAVLEVARDFLAPKHDLDRFILAAIRDDSTRGEWSRRLRDTAHPVALPGFSDLI